MVQRQWIRCEQTVSSNSIDTYLIKCHFYNEIEKNLFRPLIDIVLMVDGSDSIKTFQSTMDLVQKDFMPKVMESLQNRHTFTLVQFSGFKALTDKYVPGSNGYAADGLNHYKVEIPTGKARIPFLASDLEKRNRKSLLQK